MDNHRTSICRSETKSVRRGRKNIPIGPNLSVALHSPASPRAVDPAPTVGYPIPCTDSSSFSHHFPIISIQFPYHIDIYLDYIHWNMNWSESPYIQRHPHYNRDRFVSPEACRSQRPGYRLEWCTCAKVYWILTRGLRFSQDAREMEMEGVLEANKTVTLIRYD